MGDEYEAGLIDAHAFLPHFPQHGVIVIRADSRLRGLEEGHA